MRSGCVYKYMALTFPSYKRHRTTRYQRTKQEMERVNEVASSFTVSLPER